MGAFNYSYLYPHFLLFQGVLQTRKEEEISFVYQKALIITFHTSFLTTQFTDLEHKFRRLFCLVLNVRFKDFWYTNINPIQIWYDTFN